MALTDDLVKSGRKAGDLVSRIAAVGGGRVGEGRTSPRGAWETGRGSPRPREAASSIVQAWLEDRESRGAQGQGRKATATLRSWLEARTRQAPPPLRERVLEHALAVPPPDPSAEHLGLAAQELLGRVEAHPGDRSVALDLLAADALITLALLARAEEAPERLAEFATGLLTVDRGG